MLPSEVGFRTQLVVEKLYHIRILYHKVRDGTQFFSPPFGRHSFIDRLSKRCYCTLLKDQNTSFWKDDTEKNNSLAGSSQTSPPLFVFLDPNTKVLIFCRLRPGDLNDGRQIRSGFRPLLLNTLCLIACLVPSHFLFRAWWGTVTLLGRWVMNSGQS